MADDTDEVVELLTFKPNNPPCSMPSYDLHSLIPKQQKKLNKLKRNVIRQDNCYLARHPEVRAIVCLMLRGFFRDKPRSVHTYASNFVKRPSFEEEVKHYLEVNRPPFPQPEPDQQEEESEPDEEEDQEEDKKKKEEEEVEDEKYATSQWLREMVTANTMEKAAAADLRRMMESIVLDSVDAKLKLAEKDKVLEEEEALEEEEEEELQEDEEVEDEEHVVEYDYITSTGFKLGSSGEDKGDKVALRPQKPKMTLLKRRNTPMYKPIDFKVDNQDYQDELEDEDVNSEEDKWNSDLDEEYVFTMNREEILKGMADPSTSGLLRSSVSRKNIIPQEGMERLILARQSLARSGGRSFSSSK